MLYKTILNRFYQNTLREAKKVKEKYANLQDHQIITKAFLEGKITAYADILTFMRLLSEEAQIETEEESTE